jgi:hypothetical protein
MAVLLPPLEEKNKAGGPKSLDCDNKEIGCRRGFPAQALLSAADSPEMLDSMRAQTAAKDLHRDNAIDLSVEQTQFPLPVVRGGQGEIELLSTRRAFEIKSKDISESYIQL